MKNKNIFIITLFLQFLFIGCSDNLDIVEDVELDSVYNELIRKGYAPESIQDLGDFYIVEGDIYFSKTKNTSNAKQFRNGIVLNSTTVSDLKIFNSLASNPPDISDEWNLAAMASIQLWNNASSISCINMRLVASEEEADIIILPMPSEQVDRFCGYAGSPINETTPNNIFADSITPSSYLKKVEVLTHELGHALGLQHTDSNVSNLESDVFNDNGSTSITGTPMVDNASIMNSDLCDRTVLTNFSAGDIQAINALWGDCDPIITNPPVNAIAGPATICLTGATYTYTTNRNLNSISDWTVSNFNIVGNPTTSSITVSPASNGSSGSITANFPDGTPITVSKTIQFNNGPTTASGASLQIAGPNELSWYQTGIFNFNTNSLTNYSNISSVVWNVYSNVYPNANVFFNILHNNNNSYASIEVKPNTPAGIYTVSCKLSNGCGQRIIESTFIVKRGRPQFFLTF